jgi:uncharacterized protein YjbI with pentapeptide repeats
MVPANRLESRRQTRKLAPWLTTALLMGGCLGEAPALLEGTNQVEPSTAALIGINQAGVNLSATNLAASNLGGANLGGINLGGTNLGASNLGGINLGGTNLGASNLGGINLGASNLGGINLGGINLGGINLGGINLSGSNLGGINVASTNLAGNVVSGTNLSSATLAGATTGSNIHGLTLTASRMLYSGEDLWRPTDGLKSQCIVVGIGSSAFARLLGQQSANARMSVALGKLPWGFASVRGGAPVVEAWEALVWGDRTYCSFILAAPPGTSWSGVAGFIKAVFRWNAPATQTMDISGIEASAPHDPTLQTSVSSYTGMMDAAARWRANVLTDKGFVAGAVGLIAATTNNQSVMVDFSTWVVDRNLDPLVVGNVQPSPAPTHIESVYVVLDNGDGTVAVKLDAARPTWMPGNAKRNTPAGMIDSYDQMYEAYAAATTSSKPYALRCGGALFYKHHFGVPVPAGKCDDGLTYYTQLCVEGYQPWSNIAGTTAPMNAYMLTTLPGGHYRRSESKRCSGLKPVLSETYIHLWEPAYAFPAR